MHKVREDDCTAALKCLCNKKRRKETFNSAPCSPVLDRPLASTHEHPITESEQEILHPLYIKAPLAMWSILVKTTVISCAFALGWSYFPSDRSWKSIGRGLILSILAAFIIIKPPTVDGCWCQSHTHRNVIWLALHAFITNNYHVTQQEMGDVCHCVHMSASVRTYDFWFNV